MKFQNVKGTRDFYPQEMRIRNWIADAWRRVSLRNGFEEYDAPIFEYLDLFTVKSGEEIAEQLFRFTDRGGRQLAIRPEITPSLARMVSEKINSLPRPIKWFSIPRLCRAENPQRGRLREFFQWNIDIIGDSSPLSDAEGIFVCVDFLREIGLTPQDVQVRIGSRPLTMAALSRFNVAEADMERILTILDKRPRISTDAFTKLCEAGGLSPKQIDRIIRFQDSQSIADVGRAMEAQLMSDGVVTGLGVKAAFDQLEKMLQYCEKIGCLDYCTLDLRIVRGLAYYTGIVYEIFDAGRSLRAIGGGGRYDNLLEIVGGPKVGATGFGMGDVVLGILLEEKKKIPPEILLGSLDFFVIGVEDDTFGSVMKLVGQLRRRGLSADFSYAIERPLGKQLKEANKRRAAKAILVREDGLSIKDLETGDQTDMSVAEFLASLK